MKKRYFIIPILILFLLLVCYAILRVTIGYYIDISKILEIRVPLTCKMDCIDTHGALDDGETYAKIYFTDEQAKKFIEKIKKNQNWKLLPMHKDLKNRIEHLYCFDENMPIAQNGYWFFYNRHPYFDDKYDPEVNFSDLRPSENFSVAVFDIDTNILSYYESDT